MRRLGDRWSVPQPMRYEGDTGGIDDGEAQVSPDDKTLYFTSSLVTPIARVRDRSTALAALARMNVWDNSNSNVWMLPLATYLQ